MLVEHATHPDFLDAIEADFLARDPAWQKKLATVEGEERSQVQQAALALLDHTQPFDQVKFDADEHITTRLGAADRLVVFTPTPGPFGAPVTQLRIPHHMLSPDLADVETSGFVAEQGSIRFSLGLKEYRYDRYGLSGH
jgi:CRISPR-associated endonuclease/helicase Cas3